MTPPIIHQREWTFRQIVAELPFIPATSNWLKLLCSLLAEPLMFVSSLCIIAETVLPGTGTWPSIFTNGPTMVMSLAPEIILPGCFQQAQRARQKSDAVKGNLLFCLCALFGLLTLITLASFIWHFAGVLANLILFIRCGAGISYTIILNISEHDEQAIDPPHSMQDDRIEHLTQTVNTLTAQLTTVLSVTQNNQFLIAPLQDASSPQQPSPRDSVSPHHLSTVIQPVRLPGWKEPTGLHLLTMVAHQTAVEVDELTHERGQEGHVEIYEETSAITYPVVTGVSAEKVKQLIDAFLKGGKWRDMPGNYSQTIKPVREAWERVHSTT